jgi:hypothetical protein
MLFAFTGTPLHCFLSSLPQANATGVLLFACKANHAICPTMNLMKAPNKNEIPDDEFES